MGLPLRNFLHALRQPALAVTFLAGCFGVASVVAPTFLGAIIGGLVGTGLYGVLVLRLVLDDRERNALRPSPVS